jgi:mannose-6-phosphate isomerase-like protein (cupin superfamily)
MDEPLMDSVSLGGIDVIFKLSAEQTGGVMSAVEVLVAPHRLALPHLHEREDELCLVTNGQVGWRVGDRELLAEPQSLTFLPRGVPHAYWNPSSSLARLVLVSVPGGVERFFQELATGSMQAERTAAVAARHGLVLVLDWIDELVARHGLQMRGG